MAVIQAAKGILVTLFSLVTTGTSDVISIPPTSTLIYVVVRGAGTISSGTLVLEEASSSDYAGTWSALETIDLSTLTGGDEQIIHILSTFRNIRARLSANVVGGGTVSVELMSN